MCYIIAIPIFQAFSRKEWQKLEDAVLSSFFKSLGKSLPERYRREVATAMAKSLGHGGIKRVAELSGVSRSTIIREAGRGKHEMPAGRQRMQGGGRKKAAERHPGAMEALEALVSPYTRGDPMQPLRWTTKSLRKLSGELEGKGFKISHVTVGEMLEDAGYTLQSCKKSHEGAGDPDRDKQFRHINRCCLAFFDESQPVISVDAKKKELVGNFKNGGREYRKSHDPLLVNAYDFIDDAEGRAAPYGIYDIGANAGFVNVGISADTAEFAVNSIRSWWREMGCKMYEDAHSLYITADGGGSNGSRNRLWKVGLQNFANETGLNVYVSHFPPATSKWNKIEHRLFSAITMNWRGRPLDSFETIVSLIAATTNASGLSVKCVLDENEYQRGIKVEDDEIDKLNIKRYSFRPDWNYLIRPK